MANFGGSWRYLPPYGELWRHKKCGKLWRNVALTKQNGGATFNKKKKLRHISPHFDTVRYVSESDDMWRYFVIFFESTLIVTYRHILCRYNFILLASPAATKHNNSLCGAKITNGYVPQYKPQASFVQFLLNYASFDSNRQLKYCKV